MESPFLTGSLAVFLTSLPALMTELLASALSSGRYLAPAAARTSEQLTLPSLLVSVATISRCAMRPREALVPSASIPPLVSLASLPALLTLTLTLAAATSASLSAQLTQILRSSMTFLLEL